MFDETLIDWLLDADTPTIRALTYRHLLDRPPNVPNLLTAHA